MSLQAEYWTVERRQSVTAFLIAQREAGVELRRAINSLHQGLPHSAHKLQDQPETWEWLEARYWITFVVDHSRKWIYVTDVESATVE